VDSVDLIKLVIAGLVAVPATIMWMMERRRRGDVLDAVAARRNGEVETHEGNRRLTVEVDGICITVHQYSRMGRPWTCWQAFARRPRRAAFDIYPTSFLFHSGESYGARVIVFKDRDWFHTAFEVKGDDEGLVKRMWNEANLRKMFGQYRTSRIYGDEHSIQLSRPEAISDDVDVERGIDFVVALAKLDLYGKSALRAIADAKLHEGDGLPYALTAGPASVRVGPIEVAGTTYTSASTVVGADVKFELEIRDGGASNLEPLPQAARGHVASIGRARIVANHGDATVRWHHIETDPERLGAAIELLRTLAQPPSQGVFR